MISNSSFACSLHLCQFLLFNFSSFHSLQSHLWEIEDISYLIIHDHLLKSRSHHSLLSGLLATTPHSLPVGRLHGPALFTLSHRFLQGLVHVAFAAQGHGIGAADRRGCGAVFGVVGRDGVVGAEGDAGGGEGAGAAAAAAEAAAG